LDSAIAQSEVWSQRIAQRENDFTFWLLFGLCPNLGASESFSEKLLQKIEMTCYIQYKRSMRFEAVTTLASVLIYTVNRLKQ